MHRKMMEHALELAKKGIGFANPNPLVGAVIVKNNKIIGEGYHALYGSHHAEINAFNNAKSDVGGATMYVTLEPCSHYGKTPPCAQAIIDHGIKEVYIASIDPNPLVAGKGIELLRNSGIIVHIGLLDEENKRLNKVFFKYITSKVPFVTLKTAMSLDGKIATKTGDSKWISNEKSRHYVHHLRHAYKAIMVGAHTVIKDNPSLTTRISDFNGRNPIRVIVDSQGIVPLDSKVVLTAKTIKTIVVTTSLCSKDRLDKLQEFGVEIIVLPLQNEHFDLKELMIQLGLKGIDGILLEGGSVLNAAALEANIVDEVITFIAPKIIAGQNAFSPVGGIGADIMSDALTLTVIDYHWFDDDLMIRYNIDKE